MKYLLVPLVIILMIGSAQALIKDGIEVNLISNTDYCEEKCLTVYRVCYPSINQLNQDLEMKFNKVGQMDLEPDDYLEKYEIEQSNSTDCRRLSIHGKKGKFENVDNIPCISGTCFNKYEWWNSTWRTAVLITNLSESSFQDNYEINVTFTNDNIPYSWFQVANFGDLRVTNGTNPENDTGIEQSFFIHQDCDSTNTSNPCTVWVRGFENQESMIFWLNASGVPSVSNGWTTFDDFDDFADDIVNSTVWLEVDSNNRLDETGGVLETDDTPDAWASILHTHNNYTYPHVVEVDFQRSSGAGGDYGFGVNAGEHLPTTWATSEHAIFPVSDANQYVVYERGSSVFTGGSTGTGIWYHLEIRLENSTTTTYWLDGTRMYAGASPNSTSNPVGIGKYNDGEQKYDNFWIRDYIPNPPTWNFSGGYAAPPAEPPAEPPSNATNLTTEFDLSSVFYIATCQDDNTLMFEWNTSSDYEYQLVPCPYGCLEDVDVHGDACGLPPWLMYAVFVIVMIIIIGFIGWYFR